MNELELSFESQDFEESRIFIDRYNLKEIDYKVGTLEYHLVNGFTKEEESYKKNFKDGNLFAEYELTDLLKDLFTIRLKEYGVEFYYCDNYNSFDKSIKFETKECYHKISLNKAIKKRHHNLPDTYLVKKLNKDIRYYLDKEYESNFDKETNRNIESDLLFEIIYEKHTLINYYSYNIVDRIDSYNYCTKSYKKIDIDIDITTNMINDYKFIKNQDKNSYVDNIVKDITGLSKRHNYRVEIQHRLNYEEHLFHTKLIEESWLLKNRDLLEYYFKNTIDYRAYLIKNSLLDSSNEKAIMSSILKFIPNLTIMRNLKDYLVEEYGIAVVKEIMTIKHNKKQKQYYIKKNKNEERDSLIKEKYTNVIIDLYTNSKTSLNKIKLELESKIDYDIPIRLLKKILIDNKIEIRKK